MMLLVKIVTEDMSLIKLTALEFANLFRPWFFENQSANGGNQ
jgi:hypothetical protein